MDPRSSLTETKSSRKESSFPAEVALIKSVGAANRQSPVIPRKFMALYHRNTKSRMRSDESDYCRYHFCIGQIHSSYSLEKVLNFSGCLEKSFNSVKVL